MIYVIEYPAEPITKFLGGVDYHNGKGSTSNIADAWTAAQVFGCIIRDQEGTQLFIRRSFDEAGHEIFTLHESPVEDVPRPTTPAPKYVNRKDRRQREKTKRRLNVL
jgi:hypothetical protein